jgi:hypothetical protein
MNCAWFVRGPVFKIVITRIRFVSITVSRPVKGWPSHSSRPSGEIASSEDIGAVPWIVLTIRRSATRMTSTTRVRRWLTYASAPSGLNTTFEGPSAVLIRWSARPVRVLITDT